MNVASLQTRLHLCLCVKVPVFKQLCIGVTQLGTDVWGVNTTNKCSPSTGESAFMLVLSLSFPDSGSLSTATNNKCQAAVCECDRVAAHCFAQAEYNPENKNLDPKVHCVN